MNVSFAEGTEDPITALFFEIDQNGKHPLGSVKKVLDWINVDLWTWDYMRTQEFCDNLSWPMTRVYKKLTAIQERLAAPLPEEVYEEEEESVRSSNVTQDVPSSNVTQDIEVEPGSL